MPILSSEKACGNCQFWDGERKVSAFKGKAQTVGNVRGVCVCPKCPYKGNKQLDQALRNCRFFTKWDQLK